MKQASDTLRASSIPSQVIAPAAISANRPLYWSVQRELWENRSIYLAPVIVAAVILLGFLVSTPHFVANMHNLLWEIEKPYDFAAFLILLTAVLVGVFYCLDALHGERRDRSILFWKSLPVSDLTTVLSKALIPLLVLPLWSFAVIFVTQSIILLLSTALLRMNSIRTNPLQQLHFAEFSLSVLYGLIAIALWHLPIYSWLLLISAWARRTPFLWAFLPPLFLCILEKMAFNTTHLAGLLQYRLIGWFPLVFSGQSGVPAHPLAQLTPGRFLSTPGLWIGLIFAALFLAAAARLRRFRGPI